MSSSAVTLVEAFRDGDIMALYWACTEEPEPAWIAICQLAKGSLTKKQAERLAAGPVEELLSHHGATFISRVEREAEANPRFAILLRGVWQSTMPDEIWARVRQARDRS